MINYLKKDITTVDYGIVGHGCNASGGFGSGVAGAIRKKWPIMYEEYQKYFQAGVLELKFVHVVRIKENLYVANMITQQKYGRDGKKYACPQAVENTLSNVVNLAYSYNLPLYVPKIGCGLGGLSWNKDVKPIFEDVSNEYPTVEINVCNI